MSDRDRPRHGIKPSLRATVSNLSLRAIAGSAAVFRRGALFGEIATALRASQ